MVAPIIIIIAIVVVGALLAAGSWYGDNFTGLQIENPTPSSLEIKKWEQPTIKYNIHSYEEEQLWNDIEITAEVENSSGNYLKTTNENHGSITLGKDSFRVLSSQPFQAIESEGYRLTYDANLVVSANGKIKDSHEIKISIIESSHSYPKFDLKTKDGDIRFENFGDKSISLKKYNEKFITFQIENHQTATFDDIKIDVFVANNSGKFLKVEGTTINEILSAKGDLTGVIEIPVEAISSEGSELWYKVHLGLYDGSQLMDTETIDVKIIST